MKAIYTMVGMRFRGSEKLIASLPAGESLAFIKAVEAAGLARWMDADATRKQYGITGKLVADRWPQVEVEQ